MLGFRWCFARDSGGSHSAQEQGSTCILSGHRPALEEILEVAELGLKSLAILRGVVRLLPLQSLCGHALGFFGGERDLGKDIISHARRTADLMELPGSVTD